MVNFIMHLVLWPSHQTEFANSTVEQNTDQKTGDTATCCPFPLEHQELFLIYLSPPSMSALATQNVIWEPATSGLVETSQKYRLLAIAPLSIHICT